MCKSPLCQGTAEGPHGVSQERTRLTGGWDAPALKRLGVQDSPRSVVPSAALVHRPGAGRMQAKVLIKDRSLL